MVSAFLRSAGNAIYTEGLHRDEASLIRNAYLRKIRSSHLYNTYQSVCQQWAINFLKGFPFKKIISLSLRQINL